MAMRACFLVGRKITAAALAVAILLSGSGTGSIAFAQSVNATVLGGSVQGAGAQTGALRLSPLQTPVSPSTVNGILTSPVEGPSAPASPLVPVESLLRASIQTAAHAGQAPAKPAVEARGSVGRLAKTSAPRSDEAALPADISDGSAKSFANTKFGLLSGEIDARVSGTVAEPAASPVSAAPVASAKTSSWKRRVGLSVAAVVGAGAGALTPDVPRAADALTNLPSASSMFAFLGEAGSWIGNGLSFALPLPEIFKAITIGRVKMPVWRTGVLVAANLTLGMVSAAVAGIPLWGLQNTAVAAAMVLIWPAVRWSGKIPGSPRTQAVLGTAAVAAVSLAIGAALYFGAVAMVPGALTAWLGAVGVANLLVYIQAATGAANILLFAPDIISIVRGKVPHGYTPGFSLLFMLGSLGFLVWSGSLAWVAEAGSAERAKWLINTGVNIAYILVSGASWWTARRR